jgi:hypothetical protein
MIGLSLCLLLGAVTVMSFLGGYSELQKAWDIGPAALLFTALLYSMLSFGAGILVFFSVGFFALGWLRIGDSRKEAGELPSDNTVGDPVEGERKLTQWLSAMQSTEAYIGMIPRSAPYVPPERRPPPGFKPPRARLTRAGWQILSVCLVSGFVAGAAVGWLHGVDAVPGLEAHQGYQPVGLMRLLISGLLGTLAVLPVAIFVAAFFAEVKERDDAGADRPETA